MDDSPKAPEPYHPSTPSNRIAQPDHAPTGGNAAVQGVSLLVRLAGLAVLLGGMYIGWQVVRAAWELFENQQRISTFADEIEARSGINDLLHATLAHRLDGACDTETSIASPPAKETAPRTVTLRDAIARANFAYIGAWFLTVILLGLISRIAVLAIVQGGRLAMHQGPNLAEIRLLAREIARVDRR